MYNCFIKNVISWRDKELIGPNIKILTLGGSILFDGIVDAKFLYNAYNLYKDFNNNKPYKYKVAYKDNVFLNFSDALATIPLEEFTLKSNLTIVLLYDTNYTNKFNIYNMSKVFEKAYDIIYIICFGHIFPFPKKNIPIDIIGSLSIDGTFLEFINKEINIGDKKYYNIIRKN